MTPSPDSEAKPTVEEMLLLADAVMPQAEIIMFGAPLVKHLAEALRAERRARARMKKAVLAALEPK